MKHLRPFFSFLLVFFSGSFFSSAIAENEIGPQHSYFLVYNYQHDWLTFSTQYNNFIPYSRAVHEDELSFSLLIDLQKNSKYDLLISTSKENFLFIEGALQKKLEPEEWITLDIDSLKRAYRKDLLLVTIYGTPGVENKTVYIGNRRKSISQQEPNNTKSLSLINIKPVVGSPFQDFSILIVILILILAAFNYTTSSNAFRRFVSSNDFIDTSERNDFYTFNKPFTRVILLNTIIVGATFSYIFLFFSHYKFDFFDPRGLLTEESTLFELLLDQVKLTVIVFISFNFKYLLMGAVGSVLNLSKVVNTHYVKSLQISFFFYGIVMLVCFGLSLDSPAWFANIKSTVFYTFITFYLIKFILLLIFTNSGPRIINLYLFSYLCVIEIIPLIIGVKLAQISWSLPSIVIIKCICKWVRPSNLIRIGSTRLPLSW